MGIVTDVSSWRRRLPHPNIEGDSADAVRNGEYQWTDERT
jgi:hypothetical protein